VIDNNAWSSIFSVSTFLDISYEFVHLAATIVAARWTNSCTTHPMTMPPWYAWHAALCVLCLRILPSIASNRRHCRRNSTAVIPSIATRQHLCRHRRGSRDPHSGRTRIHFSDTITYMCCEIADKCNRIPGHSQTIKQSQQDFRTTPRWHGTRLEQFAIPDRKPKLVVCSHRGAQTKCNRPLQTKTNSPQWSEIAGTVEMKTGEEFMPTNLSSGQHLFVLEKCIGVVVCDDGHPNSPFQIWAPDFKIVDHST
jgi:hypothetical protein